MTGVEVHYRIDSEPGLGEAAPAVVLAGSLGSTLEMWDPQVAELSQHLRVVRFDTRGHGRSPVPPGAYCIDDLADDLLRLLDRLDIARAYVVGLSLGGMSAMRLAARNPDRVDHLALLCTSALLGPAQGWRDRAATTLAQGTRAVAGAVVQRWFTPGFAAQNPEAIAGYRSMIASTPAVGYAGCCLAIAEMDLRADLASITAPTLVIGGAQDPATPPEHQQLIAEGIANSSLVIVDPGAHLSSAEQPATVNNLLLQHFSAE